MASYVRVESENCKGCGLCVGVCPSRQLALSGKFNKSGYTYIEAANNSCNGCGFCYYACPEPGALCVHCAAGSEAV